VSGSRESGGSEKVRFARTFSFGGFVAVTAARVVRAVPAQRRDDDAGARDRHRRCARLKPCAGPVPRRHRLAKTIGNGRFRRAPPV